nr:MAG TPA: hypothetical protein [Caudoviricetes sp.]
MDGINGGDGDCSKPYPAICQNKYINTRSRQNEDYAG